MFFEIMFLGTMFFTSVIWYFILLRHLYLSGVWFGVDLRMDIRCDKFLRTIIGSIVSISMVT